MPKVYRIRSNLGVELEFELLEKSKDTILLKDSRTENLYKVQIKKADNGKYIVNVNGVDHLAFSSEKSGVLIDFAMPLISEVIIESAREREKQFTRMEKQIAQDPNVLYSPIAGKVLQVKTSPGLSVNLGDTVILMESMKMIVEIKSHLPGIVEEVYVSPGVAVKRGDKLLRIRPL